MQDRSVKATGDDAMLAKLATTKAGYYVDPFLDAFSQSPSADDSNNSSTKSSAGASSRTNATSGRRRIVQPLIKRGTHARVCVMDRAISTFLKMDEELPCQVVILGAGKDTSYFRYRNGNLMGMRKQEDQTQIGGQPPRRLPRHRQTESATTNQREVHWYEVDHVSVVTEKASLIRKSNLLKSFCPLLVKTETGYESGGSSGGFGSLSGGLGSLSSSSSSPSPTYRLIGHDLRDSPTILLEKLNLNPTLPTLFIMECVSMYIPITESKTLLQALSVSSDTVYIACYEPILGLGDPFGRVMERNLVKMGVASPDCCLLKTRTLKDQLEKLVESGGFRRAVGCNMWNAYETIVTAAQRNRANQSEFMDEFEELILIMQHYCFVVAQGGRGSTSSEAPPPLSPLTTITSAGDEDQSSLIGWVSGKCSQLEQ